MAVSPSDEPTVPALRCSFAAEQRGDPLPGTAAPANGLLLVERPGAWGRRALTESRLDPAVGLELGMRGVARGLRVMLIRRPGRKQPSLRRAWALVDCMPGRESIRWGTYATDAELLELPLDESAGEPSDEACYLVCTHGRHDPCCALRGRPVAAALARRRPAEVWECSHVGGDRFAANLVALPHGLYYGRVDETSVEAIAVAHEHGRVVPELLRGRATFAPVAQAAQQYARLQLGLDAINALMPLRVTDAGEGRWDVRLDHPPRDLVVTVRPTAAGPPALLTCSATDTERPPSFAIENMREAD